METGLKSTRGLSGAAVATPSRATRVREHTVEIVSDSGEGAQKCGQIFGAVSAKMGNGVWTVEIIPAEIQPPPRTAAVYWGFGSTLLPYCYSMTNPLNLPAPGRRQSLYIVFRLSRLLCF